MWKPYNIAFYVHHHGSGHIMRTLAIAQSVKNCRISLLGSNLQAYAKLIPEDYQQVHLPLDIPEATDLAFTERKPAGIHYAPLNVKGQRERVSIITDFFARTTPMLLVVDVSTEVAMLATLAGVPYVYVKQHGNRIDLPHLNAYRNAVGLLAPYPEKMKGNDADWIFEKTFFAGGISRFEPEPVQVSHDHHEVAIMVGSGGTSIDHNFIQYIAETCPDWHFHIIGKIITKDYPTHNTTFHGSLPDPRTLLKTCSIVIGNAGHNTVMEMAALNKKFIAIPEMRPFDEQLAKAEILEDLKLALVIKPESLYHTPWGNLLENIHLFMPEWDGIVTPNATILAAGYLTKWYRSIFSESGTF